MRNDQEPAHRNHRPWREFGGDVPRDTLDDRSFAKNMVALANFAGGLVSLGVEDNGAISGVTRPDLEQWVMNACRDKVRPEIIPYFDSIPFTPDGDVVAGGRWAESGFAWRFLRLLM